MKKFFKSKEAGTITPLPPSDPAAPPPTSSFATPRPFDEYQARVASQHNAADSNRPLSLQAPPRSSRSTRDSSDELSYAQTYSPPLRQQQQQQRRSQQVANGSPHKNRFSNQIHPTQAVDTAAYESYSDPTSAHSQPPQPLRPPYDRSNTTDHDSRRPQPSLLPTPPHAGTMSSVAAFSPPNSLRPAQPPAAHRRNGSQSMGVASGAAFQSHSQSQNGSVDHPYSHLPPIKPPSSSIDAAWAAPRHRRSNDSDDSENGAYDDDGDNDDEGRTPTAAGAPRSAAYPVYSGADGDQDAGGEVLISQGRYEETTLRDLDSKDKGRGKKLFAFATGSNKDKKAKQERDRAAASSPIPRASRDRDDARLVSPPMDSRSLSAQERHKEGGWMDRWSKRTHQQQAARMQDKELEEIVASRIGWLSANAYDEHDWMQILSLIDIVSQSEAASKEAARALRKEFKYGSVDTQRRAVRIWALLTLNASDRFRLQIASKRFLDAIEDTVASSKTPLSVKETMLRVLGVLAFEFKGDAELASVTKCWNKVKPSDRPKDGEPLEDDLFEFRLPQPQARGGAGQQQQQQQRGQQPAWHRTTQRYSQQPDAGVSYDEIATHRQSQQQQQQQQVFSSDPAGQPLRYSGTFAPPSKPPPVPASLQPQTRPPPPRQSQQTQQQQDTWPRPNLPPPDLDPQPRTNAPLQPPPIDHSTTTSGTDVISTLEAAAASMDSRSASFQSSSADSFAPNRDLLPFDEDVRRLHEECQIARSNASVLIDTILHEGLHADTAELVDEFYLKVGRSIDVIASQIGWASAQADRSRTAVAGGETREEALLADLLEAHGRASEAMKLVEDARRRLEEEAEERRVTERSLRETRLDRGMLGVEEAYRGRGSAQASGSRSPSPSMAVLSPPSASCNGSAPRISRPLPVPRSEQSSDSNSTHSYPHPAQNSLTASVTSTQSKGRSPLPQTPQLNTDLKREQEEEEDELQTPVVPSAKALGKRRAVSVRYPTPPAEDGAQKVPPLPPRGELVNGVAGMRLE